MTDDISTMTPDQKDQARAAPNAATVTATGPVHTAYFYYLRFAADGTYTISAYEYVDIDRPLGNVQAVAGNLVLNAEQDGTDPRRHGDDFDDRDRKRKGYFIVALDGAEFTSQDPISFYCDGATFASSEGNDGRHTFTPLGKFDIPVAGRSISVAAYMNHAQSFKAKTDLDDHEWEHFRISFDGGFRQKTLAPLYEDSGGTNMGPPPPPPGFRRRQVL